MAGTMKVKRGERWFWKIERRGFVTYIPDGNTYFYNGDTDVLSGDITGAFRIYNDKGHIVTESHGMDKDAARTAVRSDYAGAESGAVGTVEDIAESVSGPVLNEAARADLAVSVAESATERDENRAGPGPVVVDTGKEKMVYTWEEYQRLYGRERESIALHEDGYGMFPAGALSGTAGAVKIERKSNPPKMRRKYRKGRAHTARVLTTSGSWSSVIDMILDYRGAEVRRVRSVGGIKEAYEWATHILIPGGADIAPYLYGEKNTHSAASSPDRDAVEYELVYQALEDGKPLLGICRGCQMIGAVSGGSLIQDIDTELGVKHPALHWATISPNSALASAVRVENLRVNSYHHQAVRRLGRGWKIAALSSDNTIEAIEYPGAPVLGVQWHPEVLFDASSIGIFRMFLGWRQA